MKTKSNVVETNIRQLVANYPEGVPYKEGFRGNIWLSGNDLPSKRLQTIARKYPTAEIFWHGDGRLGISIDGRTWAVEDPRPERNCEKTIPWGDWQWLHWASGKYSETLGGHKVSMGDTADLVRDWGDE